MHIWKDLARPYIVSVESGFQQDASEWFKLEDISVSGLQIFSLLYEVGGYLEYI